MTADYRTRLIGFSHKRFLNIVDIACFFEHKHAEKCREISEIGHTYLNKVKPRCFEDFLEQWGYVFDKKKGIHNEKKTDGELAVLLKKPISGSAVFWHTRHGP